MNPSVKVLRLEEMGHVTQQQSALLKGKIECIENCFIIFGGFQWKFKWSLRLFFWGLLCF